MVEIKDEVNIVRVAEPLSTQLPVISDWLPEILLPTWQLVSQYSFLGAVVVGIVFYFNAVVSRSFLVNVLGKLTGLTRSSFDDAVLIDLRKPVFNTVFFFGLTLAVNVAQLPVGTDTLINLLISLIVVSWMGASLKVSTTVLEALSGENRFELIESRTVPLFDLTSKLVIIMISSYVLLLIWGINPVGWLASAGIVGIAVGFAAKDTLANLFSGFFIVADAPYKIGDYINLDTGERGKVSAIGLRSTRLLTRDDVEITIPNGVIANAKIINESGGPSSKMRIRIIVGVAYGSDVDQVHELLMQVGHQHAEVCKFPEPRVRMRSFGASSLDFNLMCWIEHPQDRGRISHELNVSIYKLLAEYNIEIPYSKQDVYIKEMPQS
jgi:MscS family membrane protein